VGEVEKWHKVVSVLSCGVYSRRIDGRFLAGARTFSPRSPDRLDSPPHFLFSWWGRPFCRWQSGRQSEAGHSTPSSAHGKNECNCKFTISYPFM